MPTISGFYGIVITMNFREHGPPHIHARYGEHRALVAIDPVAPLRNRLPGRAQGLVLERASSHREELLANWARARSEQPLIPVAPLE